jgi:hypothetical protein
MMKTVALSSLAAVALAQLKTDTFPDCKHGPLSNNSVCNMSLGESSPRAMFSTQSTLCVTNSWDRFKTQRLARRHSSPS